jgi:hypothetical protein
MRRSIAFPASLLAAAVLITGCGFEHSSSITAPTSTSASGTTSAPTAPSVRGMWRSRARVASITDGLSCGDFQFQVSSQTATTIAGTFSGNCGSFALSGNVNGRLNGTAVTLQITGMATGIPGIMNCPFTLDAVGTIEDDGNSLPLSYTGTTCLGPVSGSDVLRKPSPSAPEAPVPDEPPPPPPPPAPPEAPDPLLGCGDIGDKLKLVECLRDRVAPNHTEEGAFEVTKRVAWALRGEGAGLLIKNAGENIVPWMGYSFAAARICYPDGHIFKVLTDVPATNGPSWQDNDFVNPSLYVPAIDPNR